MLDEKNKIKILIEKEAEKKLLNSWKPRKYVQ